MCTFSVILMLRELINFLEHTVMSDNKGIEKKNISYFTLAD